MLQQEEKQSNSTNNSDVTNDILVVDEFAELSETFNPQELEKLAVLRRREQADYAKPPSDKDAVLKRASSDLKDVSAGGVAPAFGFYQSYLLIRPHPSLRILFASPELRISGILQQSLMKSIGGSSRVRQELVHALEMGRKVTAKIQWLSPLSKSNECWIHCTPLLGINESVGVWMVILVNADSDEDISKHREVEPEIRANAIRGGNHAGNATPWESTRKSKTPAGASTAISTDGNSNMQEEDDIVKAKPKRAGRGLVPDSAQPSRPSKARADSALRTAWTPVASNPSGERNAANNDEYSIGGYESRQESVNNSKAPIQSQLRPTVKIAGRPSFEEKLVKPAPINMPGPPRSSAEDDPDGLLPVRKRTYKSLSPYGIIFDD